MAKRLPVMAEAAELRSEPAPEEIPASAPEEAPQAPAEEAPSSAPEAPSAAPAEEPATPPAGEGEKPAEAAREPELLTPAQWAVRKGHTNPTDPRVRGITNFRAWIFDATAHHAGWGIRVAIDRPLTEAQYDAAVKAALGIALSGQ